MSDDFDLGDIGDDAGGADLDWLDDLVDAWVEQPEESVVPADGHTDDPVDAGGLDDLDVDDAPDAVGHDLADDARSDRAIDLDLDEGSDDGGADDGARERDLGALEVEGDVDAGFAAGELPVDVFRDALADIGADDAALVIDQFADGGLDPRLAVGALDAAGIPARVEHADIGTLVEAVANGGDVLLVGAGTPHAIVSVDVAGGVVELEADGVRSTVALQHLADAWADLDHEVVLVAEGSDGPVRLAGESMLLAVDPTDLPDRAR